MDKTELDILWVLVAAALVLVMQGGFPCPESGLTRTKNAINVAKNVVDLILGPVLVVRLRTHVRSAAVCRHSAI